jgi:UDPglucose--hexose-1-phosphate uridylyltransferase
MPELRHDPVQRRWVIISSERGRRPLDFQGGGDPDPVATQKSCPFCRGREHLTPDTISSYGSDGGDWNVRVVANRFPALRVEGDLDRAAVGQFDRMNGVGAHEVVIETPEHEPGLADLPVEHFTMVLNAYRDRIIDLSKDTRLRYVLVFKNEGASAGASLTHAHTQIMATPITPRTVAMELAAAREHFQIKERCLFCDIIAQELDAGQRVVKVDDDFITHCPYASRFPFEMHIHPRRHAHDFSRSDDGLLRRLAFHMKEVLRRMNTALGNPGYNFLIHTCPATEGRVNRANYWSTLSGDWHWHIEILPRITNVAGFEWGTGFYINPTAPEEAARFLREVDL